MQKLLLADDSITIQKVVELILAEEGFEIMSVNSGQQALDAIESFQPDIILADVDMPNMNGYQLSERIKTNEATKHVPVILLTGAFEPVDHELIQQVHADDYLVKPFESQDLISKIHATLTASAVPSVEEERIPETEAVVAEEGFEEEDLWSLEEIPETAEMEGWAEEALDAGTEQLVEAEEALDAGIEQIMEAEEEVDFEADEVKEETAGIPEEPLEITPQAGTSEIAMPSAEAIKNIVEHAVKERISEAVSSDSIRKALIASLDPHIKGTLEKVLWEVAPDLIEKTVKEMLSGSLESLSQQVEKVIWETVPDLAETMIIKEIERIRSEF